MTRKHLFISGRVQGVFFRASTRDEARRTGVAGWVRNLRDGRVEAVFEGEADDVDHMVEWCRDGPPAANVEDVEASDEEPRDLEGFRVRSTR